MLLNTGGGINDIIQNESVVAQLVAEIFRLYYQPSQSSVNSADEQKFWRCEKTKYPTKLPSVVPILLWKQNPTLLLCTDIRCIEKW